MSWCDGGGGGVITHTVDNCFKPGNMDAKLLYQGLACLSLIQQKRSSMSWLEIKLLTQLVSDGNGM
jgi:hypothetical protein